MKVVFLDIDDTLQPSSSAKRFLVDMDDVVEQVVSDTGDASYRYLDKYDVVAVQCDWDSDGVGNLRRILDETGAVIVIESDWRLYSDLNELRLLFKIWDLDGYVETSLPKGRKEDVIDAYLDDHPEIEAWVVLDDVYLGYGDHQIQTFKAITAEEADRAIEILNGCEL